MSRPLWFSEAVLCLRLNRQRWLQRTNDSLPQSAVHTPVGIGQPNGTRPNPP